MKAVDAIRKEYKKNGFEGGKIIEMFKDLREVHKAAGDPTLTKVCRLVYEHIAENGDFTVDTFEEPREKGEETSFEYFLNLLEDADNKFNREEINEYKMLLLEELA